MGVANKVYTNTIGGEVNQLMRARLDIPTGQKSVARMQNFIARPEGGASFRCGTYAVSQTRHNRKAWMLPFQFSDQQAYELEFTDRAIRFFKNNQIITESAFKIENIESDGTFNVQGHNFVNGDEIFIDSVFGPDVLNGRFFMVANAAPNTFTLQDVTGATEKGEPIGLTLAITAPDSEGAGIDISGLPAYVSGGTVARVYAVTTPYLEADIEAIQVAQDADTMYVVHRNYPPMKLVRAGNISWTIGTYVRTADPFTSAGNYPGVVCFIDSGRLVMGSTINHPSSLWASKSPSTGVTSFDNFTLGTTPTAAIQFTLNPLNGKIDAIRWIANTSKFVVVGCFGSLRLLYGNSLTEAISPIAVQAKGVNNYAAAPTPPLVNGTSLFYVQRGGKILRSLEYDFLQDWYDTVDRNLVTKHLTTQGIRKVVAQQGDPDLIWAVMNDGKLIAMTYNQKEDIAGWHRHTLGGSHIDAKGVLQPWANVVSAGTMPRDDGHDQLWLSVERYINGQTIRTIEYLADEPIYPIRDDFYTDDEDADDSTFLDVMYETQKTANHVDMAVAFDATNQAAIALQAAAANPATCWAQQLGKGYAYKLSADGSSVLVNAVSEFASAHGSVFSGLAVSSDGTSLYMVRDDNASADALNLVTLDTATGDITETAIAGYVRGPRVAGSLLIDPTSKFLYILIRDIALTKHGIIKYDIETNQVVALTYADTPAASVPTANAVILLSPDGKTVYMQSNAVVGFAAFDAETLSRKGGYVNSTLSIECPGVQVSPDGSNLSFIDINTGNLYVISAADYSVASTFALGFGHDGNALFSADGTTVAVTAISELSASVEIWNMAAQSLVGTYPLPLLYGVAGLDLRAADPVSGVIFGQTAHTLFALDPATGSITTQVNTGSDQPGQFAIPPQPANEATAADFTVTADRDTFTPDSVGRTVVSKTDSLGDNSGSGVITQYINARTVSIRQASPFSTLNGMVSGNWYYGASIVTGLQTLEGETVGVIADGGAHRDCIVKDGAIKLDFPASVVLVGYKYLGVIESLNLDIGGVIGSAQGKTRVIPHAILNFLNSVGTKFGTSMYKLTDVVLRKVNDVLDRPTPPFTGNDKVVFRDGYSEMQKKVVIVQDQPLPCTILGIDVYAVTADD